MGTLGTALIAKGLGKVGGNIFAGRPAFSGMFGRPSTPAPTSPGPVTPLPTTHFSPGGAFSGDPFGGAPLGQGTLQVSPTQGGGKGGLSSILSGAGNAVSGVGNAVGSLFGNLFGGGSGNVGTGSATPNTNSTSGYSLGGATPSQPNAPKAGLTGNFGTGQENPNGEGVSADWSPIQIDGVAGPDLFGAEIMNAAK
jgi:hypothetical protein